MKIQPCPYCDDNSGECEHVVANYDQTFVEFKSGYLANDKREIENIESEFIKLITEGIKPEFNNDFDELENIWIDTLDTFDIDSEEIDLDINAYFHLLEATEDVFDCISFRYPVDDEDDDEDEYPCYSSACIIFYSKNPEITIRNFNNYIISELKSISTNM